VLLTEFKLLNKVSSSEQPIFAYYVAPVGDNIWEGASILLGLEALYVVFGIFSTGLFQIHIAYIRQGT